MATSMALSNSLHHGELHILRNSEWKPVSAALFGHAFGIFTTPTAASCANDTLPAEQTAEHDTTVRRKVEWHELFRIDEIASIRPDEQEESGCRFSVATRCSPKNSSEEDESHDTSESPVSSFHFEASSENERTEWIKSLLLAMQIAAASGDTMDSAGAAFFRFESSGSEDCDDSVDGDNHIDLFSKRHSPMAKPAKAKVVTLTVVQISAVDPNGKSLAVSIPLSTALCQTTPVHQIKLQALQELRKILYDPPPPHHQEEVLAAGVSSESSPWLQDFLRHEADWFVLFVPNGNDGIWLKDETNPLSSYIPMDPKEQLICCRLEPVSTLPYPTIQVSISSTKTKISDLSQRSYTSYLLDITFNEMTWQVPRRYKDFHNLHAELKAKYYDQLLPRLPAKHMFTPLEGDFIKKRKAQLEKYVRHLLAHDVFGHDVLVLSFLGVVSTSRDRDLSKNGMKSVIHVTALHIGLDYGDIILFSCRFGASVLQRKVTGAKYDHIGIVVPGASRNLLRIMEATSEGIQVYSLKARLMAYAKEVSKSIVVRRITVDRNDETFQKMNEFVARVEGNPYSILGILQSRGESERLTLTSPSPSPTSRAAELSSVDDERASRSIPPTPTRRASTGMLILPFRSPTATKKTPTSPTTSTTATSTSTTTVTDDPLASSSSKRKYFCSSLAAAALKHLGWLATTHTSSYFWPGSFEEGGEVEKYLAKGVSMSSETVVDCRIIEVGLATPTK